MTVFHYKTVTPLATKLPLSYYTVPVKAYKFVLCAKLSIPLLAGDLSIVSANGEASTPDGHTVSHAMHAYYLKATTTDSISATEGVSLSRSMGHNVTDLEHHSTLSCGGSFVAKVDATYNFMFVMYAASLASSTDPKSLVVNYVDMDVAVIRELAQGV